MIEIDLRHARFAEIGAREVPQTRLSRASLKNDQPFNGQLGLRRERPFQGVGGDHPRCDADELRNSGTAHPNRARNIEHLA